MYWESIFNRLLHLMMIHSFDIYESFESKEHAFKTSMRESVLFKSSSFLFDALTEL